MTQLTFEIQTAHWHSNDGTHGMSLKITDETSRVTLARVRLTPEQTYDLMRGSTLTVDGEGAATWSLVGKRMESKSETYHHTEFPGDREAKLMQAKDHAQASFPGYDTYEARFQNQGRIIVTMRRWVG